MILLSVTTVIAVVFGATMFLLGRASAWTHQTYLDLQVRYAAEVALHESAEQWAMGAAFDAGAEVRRETRRADRLAELLESTTSQFRHALAVRLGLEDRLRYAVDVREVVGLLRLKIGKTLPRNKYGAKWALQQVEQWAEKAVGVRFVGVEQDAPGRGFFLCYGAAGTWKVNATRWDDPAHPPPTIADIDQSLAPVQLAEIVFFVHPSGETYILKRRDSYAGVLPTWNGRSSWSGLPKLEAS